MEQPPMNSDKLSDDQQDQLLMMMLIQQYQQIAMMGLGKIKNPANDKIERDLNSAKYAIDTLNMIERFTKGNLNSELKEYLTQTLTNLRLNFADERKGDSENAGKDSESDVSEKE